MKRIIFYLFFCLVSITTYSQMQTQKFYHNEKTYSVTYNFATKELTVKEDNQKLSLIQEIDKADNESFYTTLSSIVSKFGNTVQLKKEATNVLWDNLNNTKKNEEMIAIKNETLKENQAVKTNIENLEKKIDKTNTDLKSEIQKTDNKLDSTQTDVKNTIESLNNKVDSTTKSLNNIINNIALTDRDAFKITVLKEVRLFPTQVGKDTSKKTILHRGLKNKKDVTMLKQLMYEFETLQKYIKKRSKDTNFIEGAKKQIQDLADKLNEILIVEPEYLEQIKALNSLITKMQNEINTSTDSTLKNKLIDYALELETIKNKYQETQYYLQVDSVAIKTYNNMIHKVDIRGQVIEKIIFNGDTIEQKNISPKMTITNETWSINPSFLIDGGQRIQIAQWIGYKDYPRYFDIAELLDIQSTKSGPISYIMKDQEFAPIKPNQSFIFKRRNLADYFYANIFFDFVSIGNQPNRNIFSEFHFDVPLGGKQYKSSTFWNYWNSEITFAGDIADGNNKPKYLEVQTIKDPLKPDSIYYIDNFDLISYNFMTMSTKVNIWQWEWKKINTWFLMDVGGRGFFTGIREKSDTIDTKFTKSTYDTYVFSYTPELNLKLNFTPDNLFGGYMNFGFMFPYRLKSEDYYESFQNSPQDFNHIKDTRTKYWDKDDLAQRFIFKTEFGTYFYPFSSTSTNKGGLFAKFIYYKDAFNVKGYPQLLIGYSTDVTRFVKK